MSSHPLDLPLLRTIVHDAACLICVADAEGRCIVFNQACEQVSGYQAEEVTGRSLDFLVPPEERAGVKASFAELVAGARKASHRNHWVGKGGGRRLIEWTNTVLRDDRGHVRYYVGTGIDVTDRAAADRALSESEERFRTMADSAPALIWMSDAQGNPSFFNQRYREFTGTTTRDHEGAGSWIDVHPDDVAGAKAVYDDAHRKHASYSHEYRLRRADAEWRWVRESAVPRFLPNGTFAGLTGVAFDVTDQREAEAALRRRDAMLHAVSAAAERLLREPSSNAAVASFLAELGEAADVSSSYVFEHTQDAEGAPMHSLREEWCAAGIEPADRPSGLDHSPYFDGWERRLPRGDAIAVHVRELSAEGRALLEPRGARSLVVVPIFAGKQWWGFLGFDECRAEREWSAVETEALRAAAGILGAAIERRRAEEALRDSELRFRQLADNVDQVFWLARPEGGLLYLNPAFERIWGRDREAFYTDESRLGESIHPEDRDRALDLMKRHSEQELDFQYRIVRPDGEVRWIRDRSFHVRDEAGNVIRIAGIAMDITEPRRAGEERRALEEQMRHAQKLESLGVLAGGIAHDFNNLLMGVLGNAGLALSELPSDSSARATVEQIETAALRAAELTNQLLAYAGKGRFVVEPLDLSRLVEEMAHLLSAAISKKAVLRYDLAEELPAVEADATQLRQVAMNLITNASEALGDDSGLITVRTGVMEADRAYLAGTWAGDALEPGPYVYLEVADTGGGMDEETRARIFDPFFTTKFTGRGLGLAGVLGIVRSHEGAIRVETEPGRGTTVTVLLAGTAVTPEAPDRSLGPPAAANDGATVLVVDDEETVRAVARAVLERSGFTVLTASDGREGIEVFTAHSAEIDAVLLDMTMPAMSGPEVFAQLRAVRPDARVVLSSGYTEEDTRRRLPAGDIAGFIQKPYRPAQLVEAMHEAIATLDR
jgi:PAS domain S-box-containing protein